jgi:hypothetical protein
VRESANKSIQTSAQNDENQYQDQKNGEGLEIL